MSVSLLARHRAALLVVDLQEGFRAAIEDFDDVVHNTSILIQTARAMNMPIILTEQYPRGLGSTVAELSEHLVDVPRLEKLVFSAAQADGFELAGCDQVLVCGVEAHVCVSQSVHDLLGRGIEVHVAGDAIASRRVYNCELALDRMDRAGAVRSSTETAVFELLGRAGTPEFKTIQKLVK